MAKQPFGLTEGFFGPVFFVWLGASLDLRALGVHPRFILLGALLGCGALVAHLAPHLLGQPVPVGMITSAQLGVPVAATAIRGQVLRPGEPSALILGALVTIALTTTGGALAVRAGLVGEGDKAKDSPIGASRAPDVAALTADVEAWLGSKIALVVGDLDHKHRELADNLIRFRRGT